MSRRWRQAICTVLLGMAVFTSALWVLAYRRVPIHSGILAGRNFTGCCIDTACKEPDGLHILCRQDGICFGARSEQSAEIKFEPTTRALSGDFGFTRYILDADKDKVWWCLLCPECRPVASPGKRVVVRAVCLPFGLLIAVFVAYPGWLTGRAIWRWRKRRSRPAGRCIHCGYDLTGNVSGVCPECGNSVGAG